MKLVRYLGDVKLCEPAEVLINNNVRTTDVPCGAYCSFPDFRDWRAATRQLADNILRSRPDLPNDYKNQIGVYINEVSAMPEQFLGNGERTARIAKIYEWIRCVGLTDFSKDTPPVQPPKPQTETPLGEAKVLLGMGIAFLLLWKMGGRR